jgi:hypothetical protein
LALKKPPARSLKEVLHAGDALLVWKPVVNAPGWEQSNEIEKTFGTDLNYYLEKVAFVVEHVYLRTMNRGHLRTHRWWMDAFVHSEKKYVDYDGSYAETILLAAHEMLMKLVRDGDDNVYSVLARRYRVGRGDDIE